MNDEDGDPPQRGDDRAAGEPDDRPGEQRPLDESAETGRWEVFGRGVRTALHNNATAYGFSISITAAYGLVTEARGTASALETISFTFGAAFAFLLVGSVFVARFPHGRLPESGQVATFTGGIDVLSIVAAVMTAYGVSRISGFVAWPLSAFGTVLAYLLVGGLDVLLARTIARRTTFGSSQ
ncbi:hypothetical protein EIL87_12230 [Saccharopolyspora rhizosphaerae]|uniref:Uncharacterized protein n=1 Tax=Saccharopolyspora rhizosphaerae TaxID=2492662 RepID=A0A3R8QPP7_9PSEU|nr:hypothetical protein [Saccharopolyspora rhizosphaerae]RRO17035.1 hypothetical protein EIL87_12230 [Saccharopolyspora rhizosphaerae]